MDSMGPPFVRIWSTIAVLGAAGAWALKALIGWSLYVAGPVAFVAAWILVFALWVAFRAENRYNCYHERVDDEMRGPSGPLT